MYLMQQRLHTRNIHTCNFPYMSCSIVIQNNNNLYFFLFWLDCGRHSLTNVDASDTPESAEFYVCRVF